MSGPIRLVSFLIFLVALLTAGTAGAQTARAVDAVKTCKMGAYVTSLYDINSGDGTFKAVFWMWSVCPEQDDEPLMTLEFSNGEDITADLEDKLERSDGWWSTRKFIGTFRNNFELQDFPFDQQTLKIVVEEAVLDERELLYTADTEESGYSPEIQISGWHLDELTASGGLSTYPTTFGDPSLAEGESRYANLTISIPAERDGWATFLRATFSLYIVALLVFASLLFNIVSESLFLGRMGVLGSALFAVVVGFSSTDSLVGVHYGMYLVDMLYLAVLILIVAASGWTITAHRWVASGVDHTVILRRDRMMSIGLVSVYVIINVVLVTMARS